MEINVTSERVRRSLVRLADGLDIYEASVRGLALHLGTLQRELRQLAESQPNPTDPGAPIRERIEELHAAGETR
jgi:hypothetical protein